jgi:hypothetical protein
MIRDFHGRVFSPSELGHRLAVWFCYQLFGGSWCFYLRVVELNVKQ